MSPAIREDCPCPKTTCKRHALCDECEAAHIPKGGLPFCKRPKVSLRKRIGKLFRRFAPMLNNDPVSNEKQTGIPHRETEDEF